MCDACLCAHVASKFKEYLVLARDYADQQALERRFAARPVHLERAEEAHYEGVLLYGGAILADEADTKSMVGSVMVFRAESKEQVAERLRDDPYVEQGVWERVEILPFRTAEHFIKKPSRSGQ